MANTKEQISIDIEKAYRRLTEASELISLTKKVVDFRREDFRIQGDRRDAGLNLESDFLTAKAALMKSESDLLSAQLNYRMAITDLQILTGDFSIVVHNSSLQPPVYRHSENFGQE
jgi:outer membrane protein TolC